MNFLKNLWNNLFPGSAQLPATVIPNELEVLPTGLCVYQLDQKTGEPVRVYMANIYEKLPEEVFQLEEELPEQRLPDLCVPVAPQAAVVVTPEPVAEVPQLVIPLQYRASAATLKPLKKRELMTLATEMNVQFHPKDSKVAIRNKILKSVRPTGRK